MAKTKGQAPTEHAPGQDLGADMETGQDPVSASKPEPAVPKGRFVFADVIRDCPPLDYGPGQRKRAPHAGRQNDLIPASEVPWLLEQGFITNVKEA